MTPSRLMQLVPFLGGLSLHLNHLIQSHMEISHRLFGTLPIGLLLSNLDSRQLETSPMTSYDQFWNMSNFGDSRTVRLIRQKKRPSENRFFLDEGDSRLRRGFGVLGGQVPRQYGGTIFGGGCDTLGTSGRAFRTKVLFSWHICGSLEGTWHLLIWSRISPQVWTRVLYILWVGFLNTSPIGRLLGL